MVGGVRSRRAVLFGFGFVLMGAAGGWIASSQRPPSGATLSVTDAYRAAQNNEVFLIDIRRPEEWAETGIGAGAAPIDMRRPDFIARLDHLTGGDRAAPIALICARGVRSRHLSARLREAGYPQVIDVPEGVLGSFSGPGWLKSGLPVRRYES